MNPEALTLDRLKPEQIAPLEALLRPDFPESWREIAQSAFVSLLRLGREPAEAADLAMEMARGVGRDLGGTQFYISVGVELGKAEKIEAILREFDGSNHRELALRYGFTERAVYRFLGADRARRKAKTEWRPVSPLK